MTGRNYDRAYDEGGQWTDAGRERAAGMSGSPGEAYPVKKYRKRRQIIPACSADGE